VAYRTGFTHRRTPKLSTAQGFRGFESCHLLDQRLLQKAGSSSTTNSGISPEAIIVNTNIAISACAFHLLR
jgi:hypothetical protein